MLQNVQCFSDILYTMYTNVCYTHYRVNALLFCPKTLNLDNDNDNNKEIDLFRHHNGNITNIKVICKQVTMLDKCNCI